MVEGFNRYQPLRVQYYEQEILRFYYGEVDPPRAPPCAYQEVHPEQAIEKCALPRALRSNDADDNEGQPSHFIVQGGHDLLQKLVLHLKELIDKGIGMTRSNFVFEMGGKLGAELENRVLDSILRALVLPEHEQLPNGLNITVEIVHRFLQLQSLGP
jgi:hypothetical protein